MGSPRRGRPSRILRPVPSLGRLAAMHTNKLTYYKGYWIEQFVFVRDFLMRISTRALIAGVALSFGLGSSALALEPPFMGLDAKALVAQCLVADNCLDAVRAYVARAKALAPSERDRALVGLVLAFGHAVQSAPTETKADVAVALRFVADNAASWVLTQRIFAIAAEITGSLETTGSIGLSAVAEASPLSGSESGPLPAPTDRLIAPAGPTLSQWASLTLRGDTPVQEAISGPTSGLDGVLTDLPKRVPDAVPVVPAADQLAALLAAASQSQAEQARLSGPDVRILMMVVPLPPTPDNDMPRPEAPTIVDDGTLVPDILGEVTAASPMAISPAFFGFGDVSVFDYWSAEPADSEGGLGVDDLPQEQSQVDGASAAPAEPDTETDADSGMPVDEEPVTAVGDLGEATTEPHGDAVEPPDGGSSEQADPVSQPADSAETQTTPDL